ncbi:fructose-specific PTS transporter subunit EIIC [Insolitispirillum peregrinum]|uniref:fructose-specific PTS transporter subunit EIIC n=1 Tax=Insolitispirillum peregrinum TaxID=80876 RepID=UPI0036078D37
MAHLLAVIAGGNFSTLAVLAAEALRKAAQRDKHRLDIEIRLGGQVQSPLAASELDSAEAVLLIGEGDHEDSRFGSLRRSVVSLEEVLNDPHAVLRRGLSAAASPAPTPAPVPASGPLRIVGITSCPTGIAHTFMAAEAVQQGGMALGHAVRIETQGSVGARDTLTADEIKAADLVIIAADTQVELSRFVGKRLYQSGTKAAIGGGAAFITQALAEATVYGADQAGSDSTESLSEQVAHLKAERRGQMSGPYRHLMTGVSFMLPFVVAGGLLIAVAFALGGIYAYDDAHAGTLAHALFQIGAKGAFTLMVPALAGYIAFSIADRPGIAPGMIGGVMASTLGAGFLGGIVAGFIAGYSVAWMNCSIRLHRNLEGLKPVLILPVLGTLITGLLMIYVVGGPVAEILAALTAWLKSMQASSAIVLGLIIGAMMAFDMGGPVNKAAYAFSTALISSEVYGPMAAAMAAGMVPPLALALACRLFPDRFTTDEREAGKAAAVLGLAFITEGAIPFAARDPLRVIPSLMVGAAVTGAIVMSVGSEQRVPHGGVFVLPIPNAVTHLGGYVAALVVGTIVSAVLLRVLKKPV